METQKTDGILAKLFEIQKRNIGLSKDRKAHNYSYTSLVQLWDTIQPHLEELHLYLNWYTTIESGVNVINVEVVDIDSGQTKHSSFALSHQSTSVVNVQGATTHNKFDFKITGAEFSYWFRMLSIKTLGLITRDDESAEEMTFNGADSSVPTTRVQQTKRVAY